MEFLKYLIIVVSVLGIALMFILAARQRKIIKFMIANAFFGLVTFLVIYFLKDFIGVKLALNWYTVLGSSFLGLPAVIGFLVLNLII